MKLITLSLIALLAAASADAGSLKDIFENIAETTDNGNGGVHYVTTYGGYRQDKAIAALRREMHKENSGDNDCIFEVYADAEGALGIMADKWGADRASKRLRGLLNAGLIRDIVYSQWDGRSGDSEYCSMSIMKIYGVDHSLLVLDFNETT